LDATKFSASKSQRKVIGKFNRFIQGTWVPSGADDGSEVVNNRTQSKSKKEAQKAFDLSESIHISEEHEGWKHQFKVVMEPSSVTDEKFNLFKKYQTIIHQEPPSKVSARGYERFLVESPLKANGTLIAVAVLDILPRFVSSVYFMYDPEYSFLGLGKYSALREIALANELREDGRDELKYYYMGYYIHSCPKMRYKGQYRPSYLCDPITKEWHPFEKWIPELEKNPFVTFATHVPTTADGKLPPPGMLDASSLTYDDIAHVPVYVSRGMKYVKTYVKDEPTLKENEERIREIKEHTAA
ncbi:7243_t:CDS:2, partial [Paraglomus occultum]